MRKLAGSRPGSVRETYYGSEDYMTGNLSAARAALVVDSADGVGTGVNAVGPEIAQLDIRMHGTRRIPGCSSQHQASCGRASKGPLPRE